MDELTPLEKSERVNGEVMRQLNEVWKLTPDISGSTWILDYDNGTNWFDYVELSTPLSFHVFNYSAAYLEPLYAKGFHTVQDVALADGETVRTQPCWLLACERCHPPPLVRRSCLRCLKQAACRTCVICARACKRYTTIAL